MIPHCHNSPAPVGKWSSQPAQPNRKPRWRWIPYRMSVECKSWNVPVRHEGERPVFTPEQEGWNCAGCKWLPERAR